MGRNYGTLKPMKVLENVKSDLDKKFQKVLNTPASFDFFVAIHDFVEHIEMNSSLSRNLQPPKKYSREIDMTGKYNYLKEIYQGLKDAQSSSKKDLGHARYMIILDLNRIRENKVSDTNSFWKKREFFRKVTGEIYAKLNPDLV